MARYTIDFSTNASYIIREIEKVNAAVAKVARTGKKVEITLDTSSFRSSFDATFRQLDRQIAQLEKKLSRLPIGSRKFQQQATAVGIAQGVRERGSMQARAIQLGAEAGAFDEGSAVKLRKELEAAAIEASQITPNTPEWVDFQRQIGQIKAELQAVDKAAESIQLTEKLGAFAPGSLNQLEAKLTILRNRAREISPNTSEWKELNKEIVKTEQNIAKQNKRPLTRGQRLGAAGGAFLYGGGLGGGVGSAVGGVAGGLLGGVPGAFTGAAVGQLADNLATAMAGIASQASAVQQMQRGLAMASVDAQDFAKAQESVAAMSQRLLMPLEQTTRLFTQLRVNTKQYNMSVQETAQIMEGTALAIMATGGSSEDLEGAMRAVVQILSKGGVQAEELRGQLGERFPGAVVKFAQANKLSFEELQQGLEQGKIGIKEFVTFAEKNYDDYAEFSKQLATAPEFAGRRLAKAFEEVQLAIGQAFGPAGAMIQDFVAQALKDITKFIVDNKDLLTQLGKDFAVVFAGIMSVVAEAGKFIIRVLSPVLSYIASVIRQLRVMTGAADAATAKAEMDAASAIIQRTGMGRDAYISGQRKSGSMADKIEFDKAQKRYERAQKRFKEAGGYAALPPETPTPSNLTFGGPGAGMSMERDGGAGKAGRAAKSNMESLENLRDQLAKARNEGEMERARMLFEYRKRLIDAEFAYQEAGANEIQQARLKLAKELSDASIRYQEAVFESEQNIQKAAGNVAPGNLPPSAPKGKPAYGALPKAGEMVGGPEFNRPVSGSERRDIVAEEQAAQAVLTQRLKKQLELNALTRDYVNIIRANFAAIFPIDQLRLETDLLKRRNELQLKGVPPEVIDMEEKLFLAREKHEAMLAQLRQQYEQAQTTIATYEANQKKGVKSTKDAEDAYNSAKAYIQAYGQEIGNAAKLLDQYTVQQLEATLATLKHQDAMKKQQEALQLINSSVTNVTNSFKGMLKEILKGGNAQEALQKFQEALADQVLTIFLDYAFKPVEDFLKETIANMFGIKTEEQQRQEAAKAVEAKLEEQRKLQANIDQNVAKIANAPSAPSGQTAQTTSPGKAFGAFAGLPVGQQSFGVDQSGMGGNFGSMVTSADEATFALSDVSLGLQDISYSAGAVGPELSGLTTSLKDVAVSTGKTTENVNEAGNKFQESLGKTVQGIGIAAGAIMGIAAGIQQIQKGDTASVIGGIGSIFLSLGGAIGGFNKLFGANGGIAAGGWKPFPVTPFANGGMVNGPTLGLVGEGKYNEAIVPLPNGKSIPVQLQGDDVRDKMKGGGAMMAGVSPISMSFQSTTINGVEYVDRAQLELAMAETRKLAAREGAARGASLALDKLSNSPSSRRRIGLR